MTARFQIGDKVEARRRVDANGYTFVGARGVIVDEEHRGVKVRFVSGITVWVARYDIRRAR